MYTRQVQSETENWGLSLGPWNTRTFSNEFCENIVDFHKSVVSQAIQQGWFEV